MTIYPGGPQDGIKYTMTSPDGQVAVFNDPTDANYVGMAYFTGTEGPEIREALDPRAGADGSVQGMNFRGSRPVVGTVEIVASTATDRNAKMQRLRRASNAMRSDGTLDFTPDGGIGSRIYFRLNGPLRRADERGWKYTVQFPLMSADPYIYGQTLNSSTSGTDGGSTQTITNQGDGLSGATINVTVTSAGAVTLTNGASGQAIALANVDPANIITYVSKIVSSGAFNSNTYFMNPRGVATDASGNVYIVDGLNQVIKKFTSAGVYQQTFGVPHPFGSNIPSANGDVHAPADVAVDASGNVYCFHWGATGTTGRIEKWNSAGTYQAKSTSGMNSDPTGNYWGSIALDSTPNVFVTDPGANRIRKFASTLGAETTNFGGSGISGGPASLSLPMGLAVDSSNQPWVVDRTNKRIVKWNTALTTGTPYNLSAIDGGSFGQAPYGCAIDSANNVYVSDDSGANIAKLNSSGVYQAKFGSYGAGDGQFNMPKNIDARGTTLWVADNTNNRVESFSATSTSGTLVVNLGLATVFSLTGLNLFQYVNVPATQWWALQPGDNPITVSGTGVDSWTINWRDAWL